MEKIYFENTNVLTTIAGIQAEKGTLRETFVLNQLKAKHQVNYTKTGDLLVDEKITFEIGGRNKSNTQIKNTENAYILADNWDYQVNNKIPIWMVGLLY